MASAGGSGRPVGTRPSQRSARRTGRRCGHSAATHTGIRGRCTGTGWNSPDQYLPRSASPWSSRAARSRGSATSGEIRAARPAGDPFDIVVALPPGDDPIPWGRAGATWAVTDFGMRPALAQVRAVIDTGPPPLGRWD